jgi:hypothetical protein
MKMEAGVQVAAVFSTTWKARCARRAGETPASTSPPQD